MFPIRNIPYNINLHIADNCSLEAYFKVHFSGLYIQDWVYIQDENKVINMLNYREQRGCWVNPVQNVCCHWKSIQRFGLGNKYRLLYRLQCAYHFYKFTEGGLHLQKARHFPTTLPTMIHSEVFSNNIWHKPPKI